MADAKSTATSQNQEKDGPRTCKPCGIACPDVYSYLDHLESKEHVKGVMKKKYGEKYLKAKANLLAGNQENDAKPNLVPKSNEKYSKEKALVQQGGKSKDKYEKSDSENSLSDSESNSSSDDDVYTCDVCKKICTGSLTYRLHLSGNKHMKMVHKMKLMQQLKRKKLILESDSKTANVSPDDQILPDLFPLPPELSCKICCKAFSGPEAFKQHYKSDAHIKKVAMENMVKEMEDKGVCKITDREESGAKIFHCDLCEKGFSGPLPYKQHLGSIGHFKMEKHKAQLSEVKDLIFSSEEDSKIQCKECGKFFSGPQPFKDHLISSSHGKTKKKNNMLEDLQKMFPEMVIGFKLDNDSSDDDDEKRNIIACNICHNVFSGPESARDHFLSQKHKKAAKEQAKYKKLKKKLKESSKVLVTPKNKSETKDKKSDAGGSSSGESFDIIS